MPEFVCRIGAPDGSILEQRRMAVSEPALRHELESEGFHIFSVGTPQLRLNLARFGRRERVKGQEFLIFNTQLKTLLRAGLPLAQSLELLARQQTNLHFRALLEKVHQQVTTGVSLSDAFLSLGDTFPRLYANTLRAGERSGEMENMLDRFVAYQRLVEAARKKIITALTYPAVLIVLSIVLIVILMIYVIPTFGEFYVGFGSELPLPTRIVLNTAEFVRSKFFFLLGGGLLAAFGLRWWGRTTRGRHLIDRTKLRVPVVGTIEHLFALSQFSRSMAVLLGGGTPMVPALETAATSVKNAYVSELFLQCVPRVQEGQPLSDSMENTGLVPQLPVAMMRVGESTGALPEMLNHTSDFIDDDIDHTLSRMVTLFEPAVLVFMGVVVAGLLLAVYYPLLTLVSQMN